MKKDKIGKTMSETLSKIDSVLVSLDGYPEIEDALLEKSNGLTEKYLGKMFPTQLDFSLDILEHLVGRDVLIDIISEFITNALPGLEIALKAALLANMRSIATSCTIDPIIYERAIKEGIVFDLKQIDLYDKLKVSPLDKKIGQYYYFGIEDCNTSYDILQSAIEPNNQSNRRKKRIEKKGSQIKEETSYVNRAFSDSVGHYFGGRKRDFDCLLWYMKNKGVGRQVWGKRTSASEDIFNGSDYDVTDWIKTKGTKGTTYYQVIENDTMEKSIKIFEYTTEGNVNESDGHLSELDYNKGKYLVTQEDSEGWRYYAYTCKDDLIKKIDRRKIYYIHFLSERMNDDGEVEKEELYEAYRFIGGKWVQYGDQERFSQKYTTIEEAKEKGGLDISPGNFLIIDGRLMFVVEVELDDVLGVGPRIKKLKTTNGIDVTNDINNQDAIYVDYEEIENEKTKGDLIKEGHTPASSFSSWYTNEMYGSSSKKSWVRHGREFLSEDKISEYEQTVPNTLYYASNDSTDEFKVVIPPYNDSGFYVNVDKLSKNKGKYTKDFGIVTLEYNQRTGNILQSDGNPLHQQTPYDNSIHVFFGNVKELHTTDRDNVENNLHDCSDALKNCLNIIDKAETMFKKHLKLWKKKKKDKNWKPWTNVKVGNLVMSMDWSYKYGGIFYEKMINGGERLNDSLQKEFYSNVLDGYDDLGKIDGRLSEISDVFAKYEKILYVGVNDEKEFNADLFAEDFEKELKQLLKVEQDVEKDQQYDPTDHKYYTLTAFLKKIGEINSSLEDDYYFKSSDLKYPDVKKNYYLYRTLFEFNMDYVNSIQLFDPKVVAAQLITSLFSGAVVNFAFGATVSWKTELIRDTVKDMVEKTIAAEDFSVSDCFFTFTNDAYNGMLRAADLRQAGLYSSHGETNGNRKVDPVKLLEGLNGIDFCADKVEQTSIIKGAIMNASAELSRDEFKDETKFDFNKDSKVDASFIDTLLVNLCTQLVMSLLSPKVYLLILINLELFGLSTNFDIKAFMERFQDLIRTLVKSIVDYFIQYLKDFMMVILFGGDFQGRHYKGIIPELTIKIGLEQAEMYARLLKQILMHLRMLTKCGKTQGWEQDVVGYADISDTLTTQEPINEC